MRIHAMLSKRLVLSIAFAILLLTPFLVVSVVEAGSTCYWAGGPGTPGGQTDCTSSSDSNQAVQNAGQDPNNASLCYVMDNANGVLTANPWLCGSPPDSFTAAQPAAPANGTPASQNSFTTESDRKTVAGCDGDNGDLKQCLTDNPLVKMFNGVIDFLSIGVGIIVVIMIILGGIQYTTAGGNPQTVAAARKRILNAVIALVAFMLLYSFMQWLVPGGLF